MSATLTALHVRWMIRRDVPEVLSLIPCTEDQLVACLRQRCCIGMVCEDGDRVVGAMLYELHPDHIDVLGFGCTDHDSEAALLKQLASKLSTHRRTECRFAMDEEYELAARLQAHGYIAWPTADGFTTSLHLEAE